MKLLNKTSVYYLLLAIPAFAFCSIFLYFYVSSEIRDSVDEAMWKDKIKVEQRLAAGKNIDEVDNDITIGMTNSVNIPHDNTQIYTDGNSYRFSDTLIYD